MQALSVPHLNPGRDYGGETVEKLMVIIELSIFISCEANILVVPKLMTIIRLA